MSKTKLDSKRFTYKGEVFFSLVFKNESYRSNIKSISTVEALYSSNFTAVRVLWK